MIFFVQIVKFLYFCLKKRFFGNEIFNNSTFQSLYYNSCMQVPVFRNGELVYQLPTLDEIRSYCREQVDTLWDEVKRFDNPHTYYVDLSQKLWEIKYRLLKDNACGEHHA